MAVSGAALSLLVSACGGGEDAPAPGTGAEGEPIPIGIVGGFSGPTASSIGGVPKVAQAWVDSVNEAGGINGRPLKLFVEDDANNPAQGITAVTNLIEREKVVAIVGQSSNVDQAWAPITEEKGIPVIGGQSQNIPFMIYPNFFPTGTNLIALQYGNIELALGNGKRYAFVYCVESPICAESERVFKAATEALGAEMVMSASVAAASPDDTALCQRIKASQADSVLVQAPAAVVLRVADTCEQQGVTAKLAVIGGTVTRAFLGHSALEGAIGSQTMLPFFFDGTPGGKEYRDMLAERVPDLGDLDGLISQGAWVAGKLFEAAVEASGETDVTSESLMKGLYALDGETLGGLTQPLSYTEGEPAQFNCYFAIGIEDDEFVAPNGAETSCAPDEFVAPFIEDLRSK